jgi:hypothetical protein
MLGMEPIALHMLGKLGKHFTNELHSQPTLTTSFSKG